MKSDWNEDDGAKNSYVKNRTHYIKGSNITGAGTYRATTGRLLFDGKVFDLPADTTEITISSGPVIKAKWIATESQVIVTTGSGGDAYLKAYPIKVVEEYVPLDENFIPDSIARQQELTELSAEIGKKQDTITDLETIRSGAAKGATALQSVPVTYATKTDVSNAIAAAITTTLNEEV